MFGRIAAIFLILVTVVFSADVVFAKNEDSEKDKESKKSADTTTTVTTSTASSDVTTTSTPAVVVAEPVVEALKASLGRAHVSRIPTSVVTAPRETHTREVELLLSAENASEMAFSFNPNFENSILIPYASSHKITLGSQPGAFTVYVRFANYAGGESEVVEQKILYVLPTPPIVVAPVTPSVPVVTKEPEEVVRVAVAPMSCPERADEFGLGGGYIIRQRGKVEKYLVLEESRVLCPVVGIVAQTWGKNTTKAVAFLPDYRITSPLPYRPGSIIRPKNSRTSYKAEPSGRLRPLTKDEQRQLKSRKVAVFRENSQVFSMYQRSTRFALAP